MSQDLRYQNYCQELKEESFPNAYIDLDLLDKNIEKIKKAAGTKKIRIATKSIRSFEILAYISKKLGKQAFGYMCFSAQEAVWLAEKGLDNLLIAYPTLDIPSIIKISKKVKEGHKIYLMIDSIEHIKFLNDLGLSDPLLICLDIDLSTYFPFLNFGVFRSPLRRSKEFEELIKLVSSSRNLEVRAIMGYEAQIAGVTDDSQFAPIMNVIIRILKQISLSKFPALRKKLVDVALVNKVELDFVNGGGTGSLLTTSQEEVVSEIAVGSGFYCPTLFDSYKDFKYEPAAGYALQVVRKPSGNIYTCFAGGYVASGAIGVDKAPRPFLPEGAQLTKNEMAGEVQTPVKYEGREALSIGSLIFFRHAKAGELCERFNSLTLIRKGQPSKRALTYRGEGKCFG